LFLTVEFALKDETPWAPAGHVVAWEQFAVPYEAQEGPGEAPTQAVELERGRDRISLRVGATSYIVNAETGELQQIISAGERLLVEPLRPNFWRALNDNESRGGIDADAHLWKGVAENRRLESVDAEQLGPQEVRVTARQRLPLWNALYVNEYTVRGDGTLEVSATLDSEQELPELLRFGMTVRIPGSMDRVAWFGRGPHESYWDRKTSAAVGLFASTVRDLHYAYGRPQENGNRTDVRWVTFTDERGNGLRAVGEPVIDFSAWHYTQSELERAKHDYELRKRGDITVNLDWRQRGVGGVNSWGQPTLRQYTLRGKHFEYQFRLEPVRGE